MYRMSGRVGTEIRGQVMDWFWRKAKKQHEELLAVEEQEMHSWWAYQRLLKASSPEKGLMTPVRVRMIRVVEAWHFWANQCWGIQEEWKVRNEG